MRNRENTSLMTRDVLFSRPSAAETDADGTVGVAVSHYLSSVMSSTMTCKRKTCVSQRDRLVFCV